MRPVESSAHLDALLGDAKARLCQGTPVSHCYLLADEVARLCALGVLRFENYDFGLLLFQFRGRDVRLMAVCDPDITMDASAFAGFDRPVRCEFPSHRGRFAPGAERLISLIRQTGFLPEATAHRLVFSPTIAQREAILAHSHPALKIGKADVRQAGEILSLWEETFDPVANGVPTMDELVPLLERGCVLRAITADGRLAGALLAEIETPVAWVWHVATVTSLRGQGVGRAMMTAYHRAGLDAGVKTFRLWVSDKDVGAASFHEKLGYNPDGRASESYILTDL